MSDFISEILGLFGLCGSETPINRIKPMNPEASRTGRPSPRPPVADQVQPDPPLQKKPTMTLRKSKQINPLERFIQLGLRAIRYTAKESSNPALKGVFLKKGTLYATDGHRAFIAHVGLRFKDIIIPVEFFQAHRAVPLTTLTLSPDRKQLIANGKPFPLIEGPYPNIEAVIPKEYQFQATVDKQALATAVSSAMTLSTGKGGLVFDTRQQNSFSLFPQNHAAGEPVRQTVPYVGSSIQESFGFDGKYLLQILKDLPGNTVRMQMNGSLKAFILRGEGEDVRVLLMPLRVPDNQAGEHYRQAA